MILSSKCAPTVVFIGFSLIQILLDIYDGVIDTAFMKLVIMLVIATIINIMCDIGLSIIAWFLVFVPIIMMTLISTLLLKVIGSSPGKIITDTSDTDINNSFELDLDNSGNEMDSLINDTGRLDLDNSGNDMDLLINDTGRLDRDLHRHNFYDKVDNEYDLTVTHEYDLSNNPIKYNIVDNLINAAGDNYFAKSVTVFNKHA